MMLLYPQEDAQKSLPVYADVILPLRLANTLTYGVPIEMQPQIRTGMRVEVALGKSKIYTGIIVNLHRHKPDQYQIRPILSLQDEEAIVSAKQLQFWMWISDYYLSSPGEVMQAALPAHLKPNAQISLTWTGRLPEDLSELSDAAYIAAEALQQKKDIPLAEIKKITGIRAYKAVLEELLTHQVAYINDALVPSYVPRMEKWVLIEAMYEKEESLHVLFDKLQRAPKQLELLMTYLSKASGDTGISQKELLQITNATTASLTKLVEMGVFKIVELQTDRLPILKNLAEQPFTLSIAQQKAFDALLAATMEKRVTLLQGVTGSGKTLLYIELIKQTIDAGKQVLFLLPEIGLTTHLVARLQYFFKETLGVYHSKFSNNERVEIWEKVRTGKHKIVVGARSAIWLPFENLGLIIVDEEHDASYKQQDPAPRFHARDAAIKLSELHDAKVVLGSATPSIESLYHAENKKYGYVRLDERYNDLPLPSIKLAPATNTEALRSRGIRTITPMLLEAMHEALDRKEQVILFQNRRGYSPFQICSLCGWIPHCKNCAVSLTYHKMNDRLQCHYCGMKAAPIFTCPSCGSNRINSRTFGTERIEEEIKILFPKAKIARMDVDSMRGKNSFNKLLADVENRKVDVLIGTQMVVKGLDFKHVSLVGIIAADGLLSFPDFRVNERAFQLMEQVSGRAGRADAEGKVIIQVYKADHPVLNWVMEHSVASYYNHELGFRKMFFYPPFVRLIKITFRHMNEERVQAAAKLFMQELEKLPDITSAGPASALVPRVRNYYLMEILIKMPKSLSIMADTKKNVKIISEKVLAVRGNSGVQIIFNVDPV